jgi:hypothetical protein
MMCLNPAKKTLLGMSKKRSCFLKDGSDVFVRFLDSPHHITMWFTTGRLGTVPD